MSQQASQVSCDVKELEPQKISSRQLSIADSVVSQVAAAPRQLSASESILSQIVESGQEQREIDLAESLHSEEASEPNQASAADREAESAEDDYADEFEPDEPVAEPTAAALPSQKMYDNALGDDESAVDEEGQDVQDSDSTPSSTQVNGSHESHVAAQLAVLDDGVVRLHCGLEEEDQSPDYHDESAEAHTHPPDASPHVPHVKTQLSMAEGDSVRVQWSLDVSRDEPEDAEEEEEEDGDHGKSRFSKMPSTPFPRRSIFSASGNMADDVDIFSMTQPGDDSASESAAGSDFGGSLHRVSSDIRQDSVAESSMQLTPSYRQTQGRSLQQAADNEQPFAASWRPEPAAAQEAGAVALAPKTASRTPSRQSSQGKAADGDTESSLSAAGMTVSAKQASSNPYEAAAAVVTAALPSHASLPLQFSLDRLASGNLSRQPSYMTGPTSAVSSRRSSFSARIERETSQLIGLRQISNAASLNGADSPLQGVSRTASLSTNPLLSPEISAKSLAPEATGSQEPSRMVSKRSSFNKPAELSRETSQVSQQSSGGKGPAAAAAPSAATSRTASRQPSFTSAAGVSQRSNQVSRQSSMTSAAAAVAPSPAASRVVSRQASLTQPIALRSQISRQASSARAAAAVAPSPVASDVTSRQASLTQPIALSRQASQIARQPSTASAAPAVAPSAAASGVVSRQASVTQPVALSRQASQISRQPSTASVAAAAPSEITSRVEARQPSFNRPASASRQNSQTQYGGNDLVISQNVSIVPSRQQSLATSGYSGHGDAHVLPPSYQLVSQSPSVSRTQSVSSEPRRSNSLEAMHHQMSMPRKATAVAPSAAVRKLSQDSEGTPTCRVCFECIVPAGPLCS